MFDIRSLEVVHWDYWQRFSLPLDTNIVTVVGPNGSGKTTLLDALRTLLTIDCAGNRDYKSYLRHNGKPFAWLRARVGNTPGPSGERPFFPLMDREVTLACRIQKKGGEWQRQYAVLGGDVSIDEIEARGDWLGLREYRVRLEGAGLSQAIRRVLTLEQGATDKLCQMPPKALLDLVFDVFGDKAVLEDYQRARNEQFEADREQHDLEHQLSLIGVSLQEVDGRTRSFQEWNALKRERVDLVSDVLPRTEFAELHAGIRGARPQLIGLKRKRDELERRDRDIGAKLGELDLAEQTLRAEQNTADQARQAARKSLDEARAALTENDLLLRQETRLREQVAAQGGADHEHLADVLVEARAKLAMLQTDENRLRTELATLTSQLAAWRSGRRYTPEFEQSFRRALDDAGIRHSMLSEIVEIVEPRWQAAVEAVLAGYRHVVLLDDPSDREKAWALGESHRYKHFVVADRAPAASNVTRGSLLEVVDFSAAAPEWLLRQLDRIRRVDDVADGAKVARDQDWITPQGYFRERRGGRHLGVDDVYFGAAARERQLDDGEARLQHIEKQLRDFAEARKEWQRKAGDAEGVLRGANASGQLADRADEFAEAHAQQSGLREDMQRCADSYAATEAHYEAVRERRVDNSRSRDNESREHRQVQNQLADSVRMYAHGRTEQIERLKAMRTRRGHVRIEHRTRAAMGALRERYESPAAVRREIERIERRLAEGHWETDASCVPLRDKLGADHDGLKHDLERRRVHLERASRITTEARGAYIQVLRNTVRRYAKNLKVLAELAGIGVEVDLPELSNDDLALASAALNVRFEFDKKGWIGMDDGEASGGQQVMKSLLLLVALMRDEDRPGGFVFIDEPFAHLDIFNIDKVGAFLKSTSAQYILTTPATHNVNVFQPSDITLVTSKRRPGATWAQPLAVLRRRPEPAGEPA
ncbi:RecF/RecN/SMC family protein [Luteibacter rhizovicinus]|uniref:RecF/RecN/SMC family protein n=1 Tax=Luteibacter rhizovicinus TaxID=242606 RepID=A0A4R3YX95_9GAMM|nr:AAA family ATPase [Luteibacter rhizovicinus]TCV96074.1 RecF/RecN/SMC family protein [Luteibacter rhizovicinus]